ncbi:alpha/beta hydrolase [Chitinophaga lutea]|uniref:Alpha/beta hydrolase n=1 Tax=Chitinophaga lutea TaxID=2488634 RepID=A0A3N4PXH5_9BACT|nr:alpha/beta hydrolase [Chitinophaga lutea]RPE08370.1 alpha/beta hydrolase [Chitinophaga lutea]
MKRLLRLLLYICLGAALTGAAVYWYIARGQETEELNAETRKNAPGSFLQLAEGMVHYRLMGPDTGQLIIFVHGGGTTGMEVWKYTAPYFLERGYRILLYDLYGRGYSDRPRVTYNPALFRRQLEQLIDTLHINTPFDVVAMSMGGSIALDYANLHPGKVKRMALLAPAASGDLRPSKALEVPVLAPLLMTGYWYPRSVENQRKEFVDQSAFDKYAERLRYFMNFEGYKYITLSTWQHMLNQDQLFLLDKIRPDNILLIYGRQDPFFPDENVPRYQQHYPSLLVQTVDRAGHMPHYEQPALINPMVYRYLRNGRDSVAQ